MKKNLKKFTISLIGISIMINLLGISNVKEANAATVNLIKGGSFEGDINQYWGFWKEPDSSREYEFYRAYDAPFGNGSYSAAIDAKGAPSDAFTAVLSSKNIGNSISVDSGKKYYLTFYARSTANLELITYLQKADDYSAISAFHAKNIGTTWQKFMINVDVNVTSKALLAFVVGNMPANSTLYLDGIQIVEANFLLSSKNVSGYIGDKNKTLLISNISSFSEEEIDIELPYYNNITKAIGTKKIHPSTVSATNVTFNMPEATFSGIGKVFINDVFIGQFNYNVMLKLNDFHPSIIRLNDDVIIYGTGFSPRDNSTFLITEKINTSGVKESVWTKMESFDSKLTEMRFRMPAGTIAGNMSVQTSFINTEGVEILNKSNQLSFSLKPIVVATNWSVRGYEHVGDKLSIYGYGFGRTPIVNFYNESGVLIDSIKATFIGAGDTEIIEVPTTKKTNKFNIAVSANGILSDTSLSLSYSAKPVLTSIKSKYSRTISANESKIPAAKIGEKITLNGISMLSDTNEVSVIFNGYNKNIAVAVDKSAIATNGSSLAVEVPNGAQNGFVGVKVNGIESNYIALEIVPSLVMVNPNPVLPGEEILIQANGVGDKLELLKIEFNSGDKDSQSVSPKSISIANDIATIKAIAPFNISSNGTTLNIQYDRWSDNGQEKLNIHPHIVRAGINMDTKVLSIIGYGFSLTNKENKITFKYADENQTVVNPKIRVLGVYPSEEGQEIRIQILDKYHYGRLIVSVGDLSSNEVSFGPISVSKIVRRVEYVNSSNAMMGVLYISGYNFGSKGGVKVGDRWADVHYRSDFFIIAVLPPDEINNGPVIIARE